MRVFLCAFAGFSMAIPIRFVSSLFLYTDEMAQTMDLGNESRTYISLPQLLNLPSVIIRHGIILKNDNDDDNMPENETILLTAEVISEIELPDEEIYPLPKVLSSMRFSALFSGIQFASGPAGVAANPVLLLNPQRLVKSIAAEGPGGCSI